jgi:hypothetical protein
MPTGSPILGREERAVQVSNLPVDSTESDVRLRFNRLCGPDRVDEVLFLSANTLIAQVVFRDEEAAIDACALVLPHRATLRGRTLRVYVPLADGSSFLQSTEQLTNVRRPEQPKLQPPACYHHRLDGLSQDCTWNQQMRAFQIQMTRGVSMYSRVAALPERRHIV